MQFIKRVISNYRTLFLYLNSTVISFFVGLVASFISFRYIPPELLGIWTTFTTFEFYFTFIRLGIPNGMNRELPYALGAGHRDKAMSYASTTLFFSLLCSSIILIGTPLLVIKSNVSFSSHYYWLVLLVVLFRMVIEPYTTYLSGTFRTNDNFDKLSKIQNIQSALKLVAILLVVFFKFDGYIIREFLLAIVNLFLLHSVRPFRIKPMFNKQSFIDLFKIGFPIFIISYITSAIDTLPRLFLIRSATPLEMGLLSPVNLLLSSVAIIPATIANYLYPKLSFDYGKNNDPTLFRKKLMGIFGVSFLISIFVALVVFFGIDLIIKFFPKYVESVQYIKISCLTLLFIGYKLGTSLPVVLKKWTWLWAYTLLYGLLQMGSLMCLNCYYSDKIKVVVVSMLITSIALLLFSILMTIIITKKSKK